MLLQMVDLKVIGRLKTILDLSELFDPWDQVELDLVERKLEVVVKLHVDPRLLVIFTACPIKRKHTRCLFMLLIYNIRMIRLSIFPTIVLLHVSDVDNALGWILTLEGLVALRAIEPNRVMRGKDRSLNFILNDHRTH